MLGRWFNRSTRLDDPNPAKRLAALEALAGQEDELHTLVQFSADEDDPTVSQRAIQRALELIRASNTWQYLEQEHIRAAVIRTARAEDLQHLVARCAGAGDLADLIIKLPQDRRESLLDHHYFADDAGLQTLERTSRNKDKRVNRHARSQLEAFKHQIQSAQAIKQRCGEIDQSLKPPHDDLARADKLLAERETLTEELAQLAKTPFQLGEALTLPAPPWNREDWRLATAEQERALEEEAQRAEAQAQAEASKTEVETQTKAAPTRPDRWAQIEALFDFPDGTDSRIKSMNLAIKEARRAIKALDLPGDQPTPDFVAQTEAKIADTLSQLEQLDQQAKANEAKLTELLKSIEEGLEQGQTNSVPAGMKRARELMNDLPNAHKADHEKRLAGLSKALSELRDWQKFATEPKRQALLDELKSLADQPEEPPTQAARIKSLREQWRQLGRPNNASAFAMQEQFDQLAEHAFAPCEVYYQEQAQIRADNLAARQGLCDQLDAYLEQTDWGNADYRAAEQILRTARQEWRNYHPCERKPLKPVEQKFESLQKQLHERLKGHWDANVAAKQGLVDEANALLELEDGQAQVEQVKALQQRWKQVGATPRGVDQRLWKSFRKACDEIFSQRDGQRAEAKAQKEEQLRQLAEAISAYQAAADAALENLSAKQEERRGLENKIEAIPLDASGELQQQLSAARNTYQKAFKALRNQTILTDIDALEARDKEESTQQDPDPEKLEACLKLTLEAEIAAEIASPESDQSTRLALQVELMNQGVRDFSSRNHQEWLTRWNKLVPSHAEGLRLRFFTALRALYR